MNCLGLLFQNDIEHFQAVTEKMLAVELPSVSSPLIHSCLYDDVRYYRFRFDNRQGEVFRWEVHIDLFWLQI